MLAQVEQESMGMLSTPRLTAPVKPGREGVVVDLLDARNLLDLATPAELDETRRLLRLIEERGFHRGKDLAQELERLVRGGGE